jgi:hypothetical protein
MEKCAFAVVVRTSAEVWQPVFLKAIARMQTVGAERKLHILRKFSVLSRFELDGSAIAEIRRASSAPLPRRSSDALPTMSDLSSFVQTLVARS